MDPAEVNIPPLTDLTTENITENVNLINSFCEDERMKFIFEKLVMHLHDFARETRLSSKEWMAGLLFLTQVGQICTDVRQEFILLSDILGLSVLVDSFDHPKPPGATDGTVLGPFHTHESNNIDHGASVSGDPNGEPLLVVCSVKDTQGQPIDNVKIDVWEADSTGHYDVQYSDYKRPEGRGIIHSDRNGRFWFKAITPVPYPIPHDGPVGKLLQKLKRHPYRPSHMHFMFEKEGYDHLITALYLRGDPYETSDAVFGVKNSLIVDIRRADADVAKEFGVTPGHAVLTYDFVLVTNEEVNALREKGAK